MDKRPLAVIDSGLGGLAVIRAIWRTLPKESTVYLADHRFFPYGDKPGKKINRRLTGVVDYLISQNCKLIVIACNTITASSIKLLRSSYQIPFIGTEPTIKPALESGLKKKILVLATQSTAQSRALKLLIKKYDHQKKTKVLACPGLAEIIETGDRQAIIIKLKKILKNTIKDYSAVVLGCTHYILIKNIFKKIFPKPVLFFEPSQAIARQTKKILFQNQLQTETAESKRIFLTTGNAQKTSQTASKLLQRGIIFKSCSL